MPSQFNAPIPGESLTREPGNAPWEQPPLYADVQQALAFHIKNISDPNNQDDVMSLLDQGFPLNVLVESLTQTAVMHGYHTIDTSMLISPVIHEYLKTLAEAHDINVKEDNGASTIDKMKDSKRQQLVAMIQKDIPDSDIAQEIAPALGMQAISDANAQKGPEDIPPQGLTGPDPNAGMDMGGPDSAPAPSPIIKRPVR